MRIVSVLMAASLIALPASATKPTPEAPVPALAGGPLVAEANTYRFGDLLRSEPGTTAEACAEICSKDARCAAWSLTPVTYTVPARCELKANPGAATYRPGAVSGMSELLQMDPVRDAQMRYQVKVPASRQPEAVPLDQLRPSPVPRIFGDPLPTEGPQPKTEPELLDGTETRISAVIQLEDDRADAAPRQVNAVLKLRRVEIAAGMTVSSPAPDLGS